LAARQRTVRDTSLLAGLDRLRVAGNIHNFEVAAGRASGGHGHADALDGDVKNFVDSDLYKWLEAVAWTDSGAVPQAVAQAADEAIELIAAAQADDGYLNTWYQMGPPSERFSNLQFGHEMYCLGHLIQAATAFHHARSDARLLAVAVRAADLLVQRFGLNGQPVVCGHPEIEMALVGLARATDRRDYVDLAAALIDRRGHGTLGPGRFGAAYYQDRLPVRDLVRLEGHAVRALYLSSGIVDVATATGDDTLLAASRRHWDALVAGQTYITGGVGSRQLGESLGEPYELPPDLAYCETCAGIALIMWSWRLLLVERDGRYADMIERALYNAVLPGMGLEGATFFYDNKLQVRAPFQRQPWFEIACCPPNLMRLLTSIDQYTATQDDHGIQIHQYGACHVAADHGRTLAIATAYPAEGHIEILVNSTDSVPWTLSLRIPAWTGQDATVAINGRPLPLTSEDGYAQLSRQWAPGDTVTLDLAPQPRLTWPDQRIDAVRGTAAIEYGPLVYCLESTDLPHQATLTADQAGCDALNGIRLCLGPAPRRDGQDIGGLPTLVVDAVRDQVGGPAWPYSADRYAANGTPGTSPESVRLIPYALWANRGPSTMRVFLPT
jgi:DUF1680 family protein